jgi:glucose/arabinose dehydrogenase
LPIALPARKPPAFRPGVQVATVTRELTQPTAVAVTPRGDGIVADGNRIVRVDPSGAVSVVAGSATAGFKDGPAAQALFNGPRGVAVASDGTIYVSDTGNHRIRVVRGGTVSTIAGVDEGFAEGQGSAARFAQPMAIALLPSGNLLVADSWNMRLREVTPAGAARTLAGNGSNSVTYGPAATAGLSYPMAVAALPDGGALVVEAGTGLIRRVSSSAPHNVEDLAGRIGLDGWEDGPLAGASVSETVSLAVRPSDGLILLLDSASARVRAIASGEVITLAGGTRGGCVDGAGSDAGFTAPRAIAIAPDGSALVVDAKDHALRRISGF